MFHKQIMFHFLKAKNFHLFYPQYSFTFSVRLTNACISFKFLSFFFFLTFKGFYFHKVIHIWHLYLKRIRATEKIFIVKCFKINTFSMTILFYYISYIFLSVLNIYEALWFCFIIYLINIKNFFLQNMHYNS